MRDLKSQFVDWVRSKPADEAYNFYSSTDCAFAQFARAHGIPFGIGSYERLPEDLRDVLAGEVETFGALASRLSHPVGDVGEGER